MVSMQDVAESVGITAAALYRHFDTKYDLFRGVVMGLATRLEASAVAVHEPEDPDEASARADLDAVIEAITAATVSMRAAGGIYRWESRYLESDDRLALRESFASLRRRLAGPVGVLRPDLDEATLDLACLAALSVIASVTLHRVAVSPGQLRSLVHDAAIRVLERVRGPVPEPAPAPDTAEAAPTPRRRKPQLAHASIALFAERGYHDVSIEEVATAVGLTPSGVYRHFSGKADILLDACARASTVLEQAAGDALAAPDARDGLHALAAAYIGFAVDDRALMEVYTADVGALDDEDQKRLRRLQRAHVDDWVDLLGRVRTDLDQRELRVLVHAGFTAVADLSVALRHSTGADARAWIAPVLDAVLGVGAPAAD